MPKRVQSPSSIKVYKHCPRKYYYSYILGLETAPSIHQIRGNIAHSVLEKFFDADVSGIAKEDCDFKLMQVIQDLLLKEWMLAEQKLSRLELSNEEKQFYFEETLLMLLNWLDYFVQRVQKQPEADFPTVFKKITPIREQMFVSNELSAKGIIDAIENIDGEVRIMDYKTNASFDEQEHKLQLAIYSLLYYEKFNRLPDKLGIYFLKDRPKFIDVHPGLLDYARKEIEEIHKNTESGDIDDYPKCVGHLCKWSTGKCDFFDTCKPFEREQERPNVQVKLTEIPEQ